MASPSVFSQTPTTSSGVLDTSHPVTIPTHAAGDMILVDAIFDGNPDVTIDSGSSSTGWSIDWNVKNTTGGTTPTSVGLSLLATGSSHTLTLASSAGEASEITVRVVRKAGSGTLNVFAATPTNGSSSNGTPPAISPGAGTQDFLFLLSYGQDGVQHASGAPSGYSNFVATVNGTSSRVDLATCEKAATGVTGDTPGAFTASPEQWISGAWAVWESAGGGTTHATTGALTGQGSTVSGSAAHIAIHPTSGALSGQGASIVGSAARTRVHPSSGVLSGQGSTVAGSAARTRVHPSSGVLEGQGSSVVGSAARTRQHPTSGALEGQGAEITGSADRQDAPAGSHDTSGALQGQGSAVTGSALHTPNHQTSGVLQGQGSTVSGSAARFRAFATSGDLVGPGSEIVGAVNRADSPTEHVTSGDLVGPGSAIGGDSNHQGEVTQSDVVGGGGLPRRRGMLLPTLQDRLERLKPEAVEVIEEVAEQVVVQPVAKSKAKQVLRASLKDEGIAYREAYAEVLTAMVQEMRRLDDEEEEEAAIALLHIL